MDGVSFDLFAMVKDAGAPGVVTFIFASVLRPFFMPKHGQPNALQRIFTVDENRYLLVVLLIGLAVAGVMEWFTPQFQIHLWIRKTVTAAGGAVVLFRCSKLLLPQWFEGTKSPTVVTGKAG